MRQAPLFLTLLASVAIIAPAMAQQGPPKPTPEQLALVAKEDQLNDPKCGVPRNAADEYRPAPMTPDQTKAPRVGGKQKFQVEVIASGLKNPWSLTFLPDGKASCRVIPARCGLAGSVHHRQSENRVGRHRIQ